ncbi:MAG: chemotaxis protein CheW [Proteobacteria bacterium]|nr:chemotaxis protein CheW [Pseudomonadota bacterium]MBU1650238.1 chemotaxis protein CheW [Pseudomonadota bacterium]
MQIEDDEILQGFIEESLEHLADIETDLLAIEKAGANIDENLVNKVFRAAHSIKGGAGFMGLTVIQELSHAMENILGMIRSRKLVPNPEIVNVLLQGSDKLEAMINNIQSSNDEDITEHLIPLNAIAEGNAVQAAAPKPTPEPVVEAAPEPVVISEAVIPEPAPEPVTPTPEPIVPPVVRPAPQVTPPPVASEVTSTVQTPQVKADTSLRVHVSLLDSLMTLAGELVLSRNQLLQTIGSNDLRNAEAVGQRIDLITSELQEAIMLTRMQPIGNVFSKFPRVVRDLSKQLNKTIELTIVGNDVELDKTIIESINDPLTHLIRNSVDHGIEMPADRKLVGKAEKGIIILKAYHEAGQVVIQIRDDGKGLDGEALAASAISKGLITSEQALIMSDKEKVNLIFLPGFSMAKKVTDVSGRGVGMDVVKTNLDKLGGQVEIVSEVGNGTTISIKLPLTLAIIPCQIITTSGERYAIPQVNLEELLRIPANQVKKRVEKVGNAEVVRLRGNLLPLIRLADVIETERTYWDQEEAEQKEDRRGSIADRRGKTSPLFQTTSEDKQGEVNKSTTDDRSVTDRRFAASSALNIVVVSTSSMKYGLVVDRLQDSEEIVIKPLGRHLQQCKGYAGATIMGDGRIALILDVSNLARMARLTSIDGTDRANEVALAAAELMRAQKDKQALLIFRNSEHEQFAVPLNQVERIEKIKRSEIEDMGGRRVMQYRGGSLALITVDDIASVHPLADQDDLLVIVFNICSKPIGLLAIGPIDAIEITSEIDGVTLKQPGIMGSIIIDAHTTMLVDVFEIVQTLYPEWFAEKPVFEVDKTSGVIPTILIAEDSNFFRNQVKSYMTESGYKVIEGADGAIAWDLLQKHADEISMLVTDIEMPNMNGFELTETIRKDPKYNKIPIIALTTLAADEDIAKGKAVGIDEYHIKLDKEKLMACVHDYIKRLF